MRRRLRRTLPVLLAVLLVAPAAHAAPGADANRFLQPRVIGGAAVRGNLYPYAARVVVDGLGTCSGTLIARRFVLTAGHCATDVAGGGRDHRPGHGSTSVSATRLPAADQHGYVDVAQVIRHPRFDADTLLDDVTLLRLAVPVATPTIDLLPASRAASPAAAGLGRDRRLRPDQAGPARDARADAVRGPDPAHVGPRLRARVAQRRGAVGDVLRRAGRHAHGGDLRRRLRRAAGRGRPGRSPPLPGRIDLVRGGGLQRLVERVRAPLQPVDPRTSWWRTAGLGPAAVGTPAISDVGDTGATVTATVRPRGSDVLVSVRYGPHFEHATKVGARRRRSGRAGRDPADGPLGRAHAPRAGGGLVGLRRQALADREPDDDRHPRADGARARRPRSRRPGGAAAVPARRRLSAGGRARRGARRPAAGIATVGSPAGSGTSAPPRRTSCRSGSRPRRGPSPGASPPTTAPATAARPRVRRSP